MSEEIIYKVLVLMRCRWGYVNKQAVGNNSRGEDPQVTRPKIARLLASLPQIKVTFYFPDDRNKLKSLKMAEYK